MIGIVHGFLWFRVADDCGGGGEKTTRGTERCTRRGNGEIVQKRVTDTTKLWKSGKHMSLSIRCFSLNIFCFSKIWFRTHSVDLREMDIAKITSSAKSWLYADMLLKPEEVVLYRSTCSGGLALLHVKMKALAGLIRTFLETACSCKFRQSLYHQLLFRYYVLEDRSIADPGMPPFYNNEFFATTKYVHDQTDLNVAHMTEKMWYKFLLEHKVTMVEEGNNQILIPCRTEHKHEDFEWELIWLRIRLPGLGTELTSFIFKVLHDILPTQERVSRTNQAVTGTCYLCDPNPKPVEDLQHGLIDCIGNQGVGHAVLNCLPLDSVNKVKVLKLQLQLDNDVELPVVWFLSAAWLSIWETRKSGRRPKLYQLRSDLEAKVNMLQETRHAEAARLISIMISKLVVL